MKHWWYHALMAWLVGNLALVAWLLRPGQRRKKDEDNEET